MKRRWTKAALFWGLMLMWGGAALLTGCKKNLLASQPAPAPEAPAAPVEAAEQQPVGDSPSAISQRKHVDIHGLYMTGWVGGSQRFYELVTYMLKAGLNAVVIDAQDDDGRISWETDIPLARELGAHTAKIPDIEERLGYLKQNGIYTIARIVVYADPLLGSKRPELSILGGRFVDSRGIRWPDPYNPEVWAYKIAIAKDAARRGFDEIQFDYIRFPEHRIDGYNLNVPRHRRTDAIESFLRRAKEELEPLGVFVSADVFGLTTSVAEGDDMEIGQDYRGIAEIVDYILPMLYPSHFAPGTYGVANPNGEPGRILFEAMLAAQRRTPGIDVRKHRPWIQDFSYGKRYTAADIEEQIRGLSRAGIYQWILWDPENRYTRHVHYDVGGGFTGPPGAWRSERGALTTANWAPVWEGAARGR